METEREEKRYGGNSWRCGLHADGETQAVRGTGASVRCRVSVSLLKVPGGGFHGLSPSLPLSLSVETFPKLKRH